MENNSELKHDILVRLVKYANIVLMTGFFALAFMRCYINETAAFQNKSRIIAFLIIYFMLYTFVGKIYEAFLISMKRISEIIYSQGLALLVVDGIMFVIIWLMSRKFPSIVPILLVFLAQVFIAFLWGYLAHIWYYKKFPTRKSAIIYDCREGIEKLIVEYGLVKKYSVKKIIKASECILDLSQISDVKTVFLSGVHSHDRNIILKYCIANNIEMFVIPRVGDTLMSGAHAIHMFHLPMLQIRRYDATPEYLLKEW